MDNLASLLRNRLPALYRWLVDIKLTFKRLLTPYRIYITDSLGGSFKDYFLSENMPERISALDKGLDEGSQRTLHVILERLKHYPDERFKRNVSRRAPLVGGLLEVEREDSRRKMATELRQIAGRVNFPLNKMEESVFYFKHGITVLPQAVKDYIRGADFIDAGAYIGDSVIALQDCGYRKIFSIEMSQRSIDSYLANMEKANIPGSAFQIIHAGITSDPDAGPIQLPDNGSAGFSMHRRQGKSDPVSIPQMTLDQLVVSYGVEPRFIKVDIEGYALELIRGAKDTLQKFRPVLSIAVYHNPYEFFEAKPLLEEWLPDYRFMLRKFCSGVKNNLNHSEVVVLAYPGELD